MHLPRIMALICAWSVFHAGLCVAADQSPSGDGSSRIYRGLPQHPPAAEFYSTDTKSGVLIRVNIWGEVSRPGVYFVPVGTTLIDSVSSAGGPLGSADLPEIRLLRSDKQTYVDLLSDSGRIPMQENDMVYVDRSLKADMPLIFGAISTVLSLAAFYLVISNDKNK